jgi:hypothetical protein
MHKHTGIYPNKTDSVSDLSAVAPGRNRFLTSLLRQIRDRSSSSGEMRGEGELYQVNLFTLINRQPWLNGCTSHIKILEVFGGRNHIFSAIMMDNLAPPPRTLHFETPPPSQRRQISVWENMKLAIFLQIY